VHYAFYAFVIRGGTSVEQVWWNSGFTKRKKGSGEALTFRPLVFSTAKIGAGRVCFLKNAGQAAGKKPKKLTHLGLINHLQSSMTYCLLRIVLKS
jgi:hypothetical protein